MRLVFLYSSRGRIPIDKDSRLILSKDYDSYPTSCQVKGALSDLYPYMWRKCIESKVFESVTTLFECGDGWGTVEYSPNNIFKFIPHISEVYRYVKPGDIIFTRGAWMWWKPHIRKLSKNHHMIYFRGGRTIFKNWPWHLIIDDIYLKAAIDRYKRANIYYPKPINEEIFYPTYSQDKKYDILLVGEIKTPKGQWRVMRALQIFKEKYKYYPKVCIVGRLKDGARIRNHLKLVDYKGSVSREELNELYNSSKLYVHLGSNEQGPRTVIEAIRCGIPCVISDLPRMFPEWERQFFTKTVFHRDYEKVADAIYEMLNTSFDQKTISQYYNKYACVKHSVKMWKKIVQIVESADRVTANNFVKSYNIVEKRNL